MWRASGNGFQMNRASADAQEFARWGLGTGVNKGSMRVNQDKQIASESKGERLSKTRLCGAGRSACLWRWDLTLQAVAVKQGDSLSRSVLHKDSDSHLEREGEKLAEPVGGE